MTGTRFQVTYLVLFSAAAVVQSAAGNLWIAALLYVTAALHTGPIVRALQRYGRWINGPSPRPVPAYAKVDVVPDDWWRLEVLLNGNPVNDAIEVNVVEGWAIRGAKDDKGNPVIENDEIKTYRHEGPYAFRWMTEEPRRYVFSYPMVKP